VGGFLSTDSFPLVTTGGTGFKILPENINVNLFYHSGTFAPYSHSHSYDNYVYWRLQGDSGTDDIISTEVVDISGGSGISTAVTGAGITITNTMPNVNQNIWYSISVSADGGTASGGTCTPDTTSDLLTFRAGHGITLTTDTVNDRLKIAADINGSGSTNRIAYWVDSDTLSYNSSSDTTVDIWVNDVRGVGSLPYCGVTGNVFTKFMGVNLNLTGTDIKMTSLGTDSNSNATYLKIESDGTMVKAASSKRYKENIVDLTIATSKIFDLVPRSFKFKDQIIEVINDETKEVSFETKIGKESFGLIAEEVYEILPELVSLNAEQQPEAVDYVMLSVLLLKEVKELKDEIDALKIQIGG